ncbi:MAG: PEP-CTERM sorting domain-containing protein [Phycisphaeraceae bacterium]|nr:MAG: PEP-CTERM sorting domain-containing protein [Phycisphaeraceae bacterium]
MNRSIALLALVCGVYAPTAAAQSTVFFSDFESPLSAQISPGVAAVTGVQGYQGLGPAGNAFAGSFLRSPTGNLVTLTLVDLPPHDAVDVLFLFAAIDSLDGTGTFPEGDFLHVRVDGGTIFRESFANATPFQDQTYVPPPGVELARRVDLGFSGPGGFYTDSAYNLAADPVFSGIPHTAPTLTISFIMEGPGIQPLDDESWALDNLRIVLHGGCIADFNADGFVDFFDFLDFVECFEGVACPPDASPDIDGDGFVDFFDFIAFVDAFEIGC